METPGHHANSSVTCEPPWRIASAAAVAAEATRPGSFLDLVGSPCNMGAKAHQRRLDTGPWRNMRALMLCAVLAGLIAAVVVACNGSAIGRPRINPVGAHAGVP